MSPTTAAEQRKEEEKEEEKARTIIRVALTEARDQEDKAAESETA